MRLTYWTGVWQPAREAISKEVEILRRLHGRPAPVVSFALHQQSGFRRRDRVLLIGGHRHAWLHLAAAVIERRGDLTHAFGAVGGWHLLRSLGRRPIVYTAALHGAPLDRALYDKVALFAAESRPIADALVNAGVPAARIEIVYPGVDLGAFAPAPPPIRDRFRLLFASTPSRVSEFAERGIPLMVEAARRAADIEFVLLWRSWGNREEARRALAALDPPSNVIVDMRDAADMPAEYHGAHATVCCYTDGFGKSCPNSVVEGLASARPAIVSAGVGVAGLLAEHGAGVVVPPSVDGLLAGVRGLRADFDGFARRARALAESSFNLTRFIDDYMVIYERAAAAASRAARRAQAEPCEPALSPGRRMPQ